MTAKTAAQQQLDFLKKLKEQQRSPGAKARAPQQSQTTQQDTQTQRLTQVRAAASSAGRVGGGQAGRAGARGKSVARRIPLSAKAWSELKTGGLDRGLLKLNQELGDWAVTLLLNMPQGLKTLPESVRAEVFEKVRAWAQERGLV
jgi:hypothetical protein